MNAALWRRAWERWKVVAHAIGNFQARLVLCLVYFVVVPPFALIAKLFMDPLRLGPTAHGSFWIDRKLPDSSSDAARWQWHRRQY